MSSPFQFPEYLEPFFVRSRENEEVFVLREEVENEQLEQFADFILDEVLDCAPSSFDTKGQRLAKMRRDRYHNFSPEQIEELENKPDYINVGFKPFSSGDITFKFVEGADGSHRLKEVWFMSLQKSFLLFNFTSLIPLFNGEKLNELIDELSKEISWFYKTDDWFMRKGKNKNLTKSFKRLIRG